ncbi:MAG TPA: hypothetical protein VLZ12_10135 [Verrucomicrobiae bacterium]|nr:hypothetical protein [Verrucomicrobiae bacterium]
MKLRISIAVLCLAISFIGRADTNLYDDGTWFVDGATDPGPNPSDIVVTMDGATIGVFSEMKLYFNVPNVGTAQVFSIKGNGTLQPSLPPPGEPGGVFQMAGYWDCEQGLIPAVVIQEIALPSKGSKKGLLQMSGQISNLNSMQADDLTLKFYPVETDSVRVRVSYQLKATRDFCVDQTKDDTQEEFYAVTMLSNYLSSEANENNQVRYVKIKDKICSGFDCVTKKKSFCADLINQDGYIINTPRRLGKPDMFLMHTSPVPRNTPTLMVSFRAPSKRSIKPQGYVTASTDPAAQNVSFWGNWVDVKHQYKARHKVGRFRFTLEIEPPQERNCDREQ